MTTEISFQGGYIFNNHAYPEIVNTQSKAMLKQMGKNVNLNYATVNEAGAINDLKSIGFSLRYTSSVDTMTNINSSLVDDRVSSMVKDYFGEPIEVVRGTDVFLSLIQHTIDNQVSEFKDSFFTSSSRSEGHYFSYQLTFYSMRKASYCFLILSFISFKDQGSIFGIPTKFRSGVSYKAQIFECKKVLNNVLYNFGILPGGESMGSPDGKHTATLSADGNFSIGSRWQSGSGGKGRAPSYLSMQEDANLVIYDAAREPVWASGSQPGRFSRGPYRLELQNDGNLVVYDSSSSALWSIGPA
ncbi:alpha-D-mannose-specific plant lectin, partial [Ceratobasidium sp. AG-I]